MAEKSDHDPSKESSAHADGAAVPSDVVETSLAEKARTLVEEGGNSTLSTMSRKHGGYPFGSVMPYGLGPLGEPTFLISSMAMHTRNLLNDPKATLLITQATSSPNPLGAGRISLMGQVEVVEGEEAIAEVATNYLTRNPQAKNWMHFGDFKFFKMNLLDIYFVGGFGVMGWIAPQEYTSANPDPLAAYADGIIAHMNEDHRDAMVAMAKAFCKMPAQDAEMTSVDRLGFNLRVVTQEGMKGGRVSFPNPAVGIDGLREVFASLAKAARQQDE